jgi:light-regulated signal transduction histidine kinase (bacteriophytochrome)
MTPATAKAPDSASLERLGGATFQIVHDLKNQLNGLKLYATFLRKRLAREDQPEDERQTLAKLIVGLDRAAKDLTALVRFARPLELRKQAGIDVKRIAAKVIAEAAERETGGLPKVIIASEFANDSFIGEFDPAVLTEAIQAITDDVRATISAKDPQPLSMIMRRNESSQAVLEWRGGHFRTRHQSLAEGATIHAQLATKMIQAHGGDVVFGKDVIRVSLPLSNHQN